MIRFFAKRLAMMLVALFLIILLTFVIEHSIPGGPFTNDRRVSPEVEAALNEKYHLNDPLPKQFFDYLGGILHGDFGPSQSALNGVRRFLNPAHFLFAARVDFL